MNSSIGIVGAGISGLTLALRLQQLEVECTLYTDRDEAGLASGRLPNTVARFPAALERDVELGLPGLPRASFQMSAIHFAAGAPLELSFLAAATRPFAAIDFRVLLPMMLSAFRRRGGEIVTVPGRLHSKHIDQIGEQHDLLVLASGRSATDAILRRDPLRSPFETPQRNLFAGIFGGIALPAPLGLSFNLAPGVGEVFQMPIWTAHGLRSNLLIEAVPGGPLDPVTRLDPQTSGFSAVLYRALSEFAPAVAARVHPERLAVVGDSDWLRGAVTPVVRQFSTRLPSGRLVIAIGDAWISNDPVTGQGANVASHCAWEAAQAIATAERFDDTFATELEDRLWSYAGPITAWTNAFLGMPPQHVIEYLMAASRDARVATTLADGFADPVPFATALSTAAGTELLMANAQREAA